MSSRYFYLRTLFYILLLIGFSGLAVWLFFQNVAWVFWVLTAIGIVVSAIQILGSFDTIQQKIAYFFNAVENEDSTLYYSEKVAHKPLRELHKSLNRINLIIKDAKLKNQEQEHYFAALLEQVATGIVVINANGNILQANTAAKKLLNYNTLTHIVQLKRVDENLYKAFTRLSHNNRQLVNLTHPNTSTQLSLQASSFEVRRATYTLVAIQDIRNELEAKEVDSWLKLIRVLTHEIMNSITPITSLSETLIGYYKNPSETTNPQRAKNTLKGLEVIKERGLGLIHFVESYRKLTKVSPPIFKSIALTPFIEHILLLVANETANTPIRFVQEVSPKDLKLRADETQLSQVLINLIKNAIQAVIHSQEPVVKIVAKQNQEKRCQLAVIDNGVGIAAERLEQIFIPFFTTKENGSGIGLSISRQIMHNHGGTIKVISQPEKGSTFILEF